MFNKRLLLYAHNIYRVCHCVRLAAPKFVVRRQESLEPDWMAAGLDLVHALKNICMTLACPFIWVKHSIVIPSKLARLGSC